MNSALQRAREQVWNWPLRHRTTSAGPASPADRELVGRYAAAFENADMATLVALLREDAVLEMPPLPGWFRGRDAIAAFLGSHVLGRPGGFLMLPTAANGQPAFAAYARDKAGGYGAHGICVLTVAGTQVSRIVSFNDPGLFAVFGFPARLSAGRAGTGAVPRVTTDRSGQKTAEYGLLAWTRSQTCGSSSGRCDEDHRA